MEARMSNIQAAADFSNPREVIVTFAFSKGWQIISPDTANGFPPGGGLEPPDEGALKISIAPLNLSSMSSPQAQAAIAKRTAELSSIAQALALAQVEFANALERYAAHATAD